MKHIHPFPARMAPEIALEKIHDLRTGQTVLDPMAGSGMVLTQAVRSGIRAIGVDLDPLALLISRVGTTRIDENEAMRVLDKVLARCTHCSSGVSLSWIDSDPETKKFIDFWFLPKQIAQLRMFIHSLRTEADSTAQPVCDCIKVALSRLIISKEPKASRARDTAHSRPHRTIVENDFDIFEAMPSSLRHVLRALKPETISASAKIIKGDARKLKKIKDTSVDCIVTSPPYLNAIDYMRGHRLSLVWLGYKLKRLHEIRRNTIGSTAQIPYVMHDLYIPILEKFGLTTLKPRMQAMIYRFIVDMEQQLCEAYRVLKKGCTATYVIGDSTQDGITIKNSELVIYVAEKAGFSLAKKTTREIPSSKRYMPVNVITSNKLAARMRKEHILEFRKAG